MPAAPKDSQTGLTENQAEFVRQYVRNGGNGTQAAIESGYSKDSAHQRAYELLQKDHVLKAIRDEQHKYIDSKASQMFEVIQAIAVDDDAPASVRLAAALAWSDRAGYKHAEKTEDVTKHTPEQEAKRIKELQEKLGNVIPLKGAAGEQGKTKAIK